MRAVLPNRRGPDRGRGRFPGLRNAADRRNRVHGAGISGRQRTAVAAETTRLVRPGQLPGQRRLRRVARDPVGLRPVAEARGSRRRRPGRASDRAPDPDLQPGHGSAPHGDPPTRERQPVVPTEKHIPRCHHQSAGDIFARRPALLVCRLDAAAHRTPDAQADRRHDHTAGADQHRRGAGAGLGVGRAWRWP